MADPAHDPLHDPLTKAAQAASTELDDDNLQRSISGRLLFFYVLGDVLGSGIYVLIGAVAAAVGGAFWLAFLAGVTVATLTGLAYAELVTKYPQAAGAALYVSKAFRKPFLTFIITICMLSATFAAAGSLATGFSSYFAQVWELPPPLLIAVIFVASLAVVNFIGITESVVANMVMTFVEVAGLAVVVLIGIVYVSRGEADFSVLLQFDTDGSPVFAVVAGVALAFFAMTGFENAANVAEETVDPSRNFPRALIGGMVGAGIIYVVVAMTAALTVPVDTLAESDAALLEVIKADIIPVPVGVMTTIFAIVAMVAITNTTLVALVTQSRILYGMAREDVVPGVFAKVHAARRSPWVALIFSALVVTTLLVVGHTLDAAGIGGSDGVVERLATVTVVFTLFIYALVIVAAFVLRRDERPADTFRAPTVLLVVGVVGNAALLVYVVVDDPTSLLWCAGLLALGLLLYVAERAFGRRGETRPPPGTAARTGDATTEEHR
ncbi:amino acid transporter [Nocardioides zeae]|uniref:Amino acid transporter n=1 Tax=Nocardioides zeae TaxID=1457234 RepID=A0ACC6IDQ6_9ACTN|nr:APC family permease [Nocardioides zeae]MDR6175825.1 amino acid transporter [Nocardioides zeae]MDR6208753.1 amino acid transporter [Nocardioides zeae]